MSGFCGLWLLLLLLSSQSLMFMEESNHLDSGLVSLVTKWSSVCRLMSFDWLPHYLEDRVQSSPLSSAF